jgi:TRAP-type C4-dicarboxylate transport system permease small subunit
MVWGMVAVAALKGSHTALTFLVDKVPRLPNLILQLIVALASSGTMGLVCWRLVVYGIDEWEKLSRTNVLRLPYGPFVWIGSFACAVTALIFLARVPEIIGKMRKEQD